MIDVFVCTNDVNYTIALAELRRRWRPALVLYDPRRSDRRVAYRVWQRPIKESIHLVRRLGRFRLLSTVYMPHHRINISLMGEVHRARHLGYLDDGIDTLRRRPQNFDLDAPPAALPRCAGPHPYLTFLEYRYLPDWLTAFDVRRVCALRELHISHKPLIDLQGVDHLFVESPGLEIDAVITALGIDPSRSLCVRHPSPPKRGVLPPYCRTVDGRNHDLEGTVLAARSVRLYFGATMTYVFAVLCGVTRDNLVYLQLDEKQRDSMVLPGRKEPLSGRGLRNPLLLIHADDEGRSAQRDAKCGLS